MKNKNAIAFYLTFFLCLFVILFGVGCDVVAPDVSKAQSEKEQLKVQKEALQIEREQLHEMRRIADALERMN